MRIMNHKIVQRMGLRFSDAYIAVEYKNEDLLDIIDLKPFSTGSKNPDELCEILIQLYPEFSSNELSRMLLDICSSWLEYLEFKNKIQKRQNICISSTNELQLYSTIPEVHLDLEKFPDDFEALGNDGSRGSIDLYSDDEFLTHQEIEEHQPKPNYILRSNSEKQQILQQEKKGRDTFFENEEEEEEETEGDEDAQEETEDGEDEEYSIDLSEIISEELPAIAEENESKNCNSLAQTAEDLIDLPIDNFGAKLIQIPSSSIRSPPYKSSNETSAWDPPATNQLEEDWYRRDSNMSMPSADFLATLPLPTLSEEFPFDSKLDSSQQTRPISRDFTTPEPPKDFDDDLLMQKDLTEEASNRLAAILNPFSEKKQIK